MFVFCTLVTQNKGQENKTICMQNRIEEKEMKKQIISRATVLQQQPWTAVCPSEIDALEGKG